MIVLDIILCLIEFSSVYIFFDKLLSKKYSGVICLPLAIAISTGISVIYNESGMIVKTICNFIVILSVCMALYKGSVIQKVSLIVTSLYMFSIIDIICGNLLALILNEQFLDVFYSSFTYRLIVCLIIKGIDILALFLIYKGINGIQYNIDTKYWGLYGSVMTIFLVITIAFINIYSEYSTDNAMSMIYFILSFAFLAMSIVVIYFFIQICSGFQKDKKIYMLEAGYDALKEKMVIYDEMSETYNKFRHDAKNHLLNAYALIEKGKPEAAADLIKKTAGIIESSKLTINIKTGNEIVDAVLTSKYSLCKSSSLAFEYHTDDLNDLKADSLDISSLLSNMIDNAIEAAERSDDHFVKVSIFRYNAYWVFSVENGCIDNKTIERTTNQLISSKPDKIHHGYGSKIIKDIAEKYNGEAVWESDGTIFKTTVLIKAKE